MFTRFLIRLQMMYSFIIAASFPGHKGAPLFHLTKVSVVSHAAVVSGRHATPRERCVTTTNGCVGD